MKLKKIASLALAGVMAVSMLAGCATKETENNNNQGTAVVVTNADTVVKAFNDAQDTVKFTADASLQKAAEEAVADYAAATNAATLKSYAQYFTGVDSNKTTFTANTKNTETVVLANVANSVTNTIWGKDAAVKAAVDAMETAIANYDTTTFQEKVTNIGDTYYDYTYTGKVGVTTYTAVNGTVYYYVVYTITRDVTEQTYTGM